MKRRFVLAPVAAAVTAGAALLACVDLLHATDYDTLCTVSPGDPACTDAGTTDAPTDRKVDAPDTARPHPDFCSWTSTKSLEEAKRACAWLGACEGPVKAISDSDSVLGLCLFRAQLAFDCKANRSLRPRGAVDELWACLATVESCNDVHRCLFPVSDQPCNAVTTSACSRATRSETVRLECIKENTNGKPAGIEPCLISGRTCADKGASDARCTGIKGLACTEAKCSGTSAVYCMDGGADLGFDCAGYGGGACVASAAGPSCAPGPTADACSDETAPVCNSDVVSACVNGKKTRIDCAALGLPCDSTGVPAHDLAAACIDRAGTCKTSDNCSGPLLTSCVRGKEYSIDCAAFGLGACKKNTQDLPSCGPPK